jgi:hypothetical protein
MRKDKICKLTESIFSVEFAWFRDKTLVLRSMWDLSIPMHDLSGPLERPEEFR